MNLKEELLSVIKDTIANSSVMNEVLKTSDVKKYLKCSVSKVERLRNKNLLPFKFVDGTYYYLLSDVRKLVGVE